MARTADEQLLAILDHASKTYGTEDIEPLMQEFLFEIESGVLDRDEALTALTGLLRPMPPYLPLAKAGIVEVLEYCMRSLRWPELRNALTLLSQPNNDLRVQRSAERVLSAYSDHWDNAVIYSRYRI